jgi:thymidylate synthase (FAD)
MTPIKVELLAYTPLNIIARAIRTCWDSHDKSDTRTDTPAALYAPEACTGYVPTNTPICGPDDRDLIDRIGNKLKHESVKNHASFTFNITGITTKTLLALTRHDIGVEFSVQSTRYTTKKSVKSGQAGYTKSKSDLVNKHLETLNGMIKECVEAGLDNDEISMLLPQAWQYNLVCTMSVSALQHFLNLRLSKGAHWDIRDLALQLQAAIPSEYKYLFEQE